MAAIFGLHQRRRNLPMKKSLKCVVWMVKGFAIEIKFSEPGINPVKARSGEQTNLKIYEQETK